MIRVRADAAPDVRRWALPALVVGLVGLTLSALGWAADPARFFRAYLMAYAFWVGIPLGCLALALLQFLSGGVWGLVLRRVAESGASTLPLMLVLFVPLLFGLPALYPWARPEVVAADATLQQKALYLNAPFFVLRATFYFVSWLALAFLLARWSAEQDRTGDPRLLRKLQNLAAGGLILLGLTVSFAAIDWLMSLEPSWYSTAYPPMVATGALLSALAFTTAVAILLARRAPLAAVVSPQVLNDLGSLLLAFLMLWTYIAYFQYLLVWAGNLSEEIPWYLRRLDGAWQAVAFAVALGGFALPFVLLVFRGLKRSAGPLLAIAACLLVTRLLDTFWLVEPAFPGATLDWIDLAAVLGLGGVWLALFARRLAALPLLPPHDSRLGEPDRARP